MHVWIIMLEHKNKERHTFFPCFIILDLGNLSPKLCEDKAGDMELLIWLPVLPAELGVNLCADEDGVLWVDDKLVGVTVILCLDEFSADLLIELSGVDFSWKLLFTVYKVAAILV